MRMDIMDMNIMVIITKSIIMSIVITEIVKVIHMILAILIARKSLSQFIDILTVRQHAASMIININIMIMGMMITKNSIKNVVNTNTKNHRSSNKRLSQYLQWESFLLKKVTIKCVISSVMNPSYNPKVNIPSRPISTSKPLIFILSVILFCQSESSYLPV